MPVLRQPVESTQYTSVAFGKRCGEARVRPSMGSVGDAYDNAMAESFFSTLEAELLNRRPFTSQAEARMACFSYIEGWYNPVRLHSALGYRSPLTYEADNRSAAGLCRGALRRRRCGGDHGRRIS
jgi:putative transposase